MKVYYLIKEGKIDFFANGKFLESKRFRFWYDDNGNFCDNIQIILKQIKNKYNSELFEAKIKYRNLIKKHYYCYPLIKHKTRIQKLQEQFKLIKLIAQANFKSKMKQKSFIQYMKQWVINYKSWEGYAGGWNKYEGVSNSYNQALNNNLKPLFMLPPYIRNLIRKHKIKPLEYHHAEINEKIKLIPFYSPADILDHFKQIGELNM